MGNFSTDGRGDPGGETRPEGIAGKARGFIPVYEPWIGRAELARLVRCVKSGWISSIGEEIRDFEARFATLCDRRFGVACSNGTAALHLALAALDLRPGDEVIVPALTFVATANAVRYTGATAVFADADPVTWNVDPGAVERRVTRRTRAIIAVHLYGQPADVASLGAIARRSGASLIEDAAEAHGARVRGRPVGSFGALSCFSFYGNKMVTTGEGGMVLTSSRKLDARLRLLRDHAMSPRRRYYHAEVGFNYRMTTLQAAIGLAQLDRFARILERKQRIARWYRRGLAGLPLDLPARTPGTENVYWMFSVVLRREARLDRAVLGRRLLERGIDWRPFFVPIPELPPYRDGRRYPVADRLGADGLNLPSGPLLAERQVRFICDAIADLLA
jgi:perosamine synthetase